MSLGLFNKVEQAGYYLVSEAGMISSIKHSEVDAYRQPETEIYHTQLARLEAAGIMPQIVEPAADRGLIVFSTPSDAWRAQAVANDRPLYEPTVAKAFKTKDQDNLRAMVINSFDDAAMGRPVSAIRMQIGKQFGTAARVSDMGMVTGLRSDRAFAMAA